MSYIQDILGENEKILYSAKVHWAVFLQSTLPFIIGIVIIVVSLPMAAIISTADNPAPDPTINNIMASGLLCIGGLFFLTAFFLALEALIIMATTEFAVTNKRVIAKSGFIRRHTLEILLSKIESVDVQQSVLGRILDFGTVKVVGTGGTKGGFKAIAQPMIVRKNITHIVEKYMQAFAEYQRNI